MFNLIIGLKEISDSCDITIRKAVRCVAYNQEGKLLMVKNKKGDYKFPGGGIKDGENLLDALSREIQEETGFCLINSNDVLGKVEERKIDEKDKAKIFVMQSMYINCEVDCSLKLQQDLDDYEKELGFTVEFVSIDEAIQNNESILRSKENDINFWVYRETEVLKELKNMVKKEA